MSDTNLVVLLDQSTAGAILELCRREVGRIIPGNPDPDSELKDAMAAIREAIKRKEELEANPPKLMISVGMEVKDANHISRKLQPLMDSISFGGGFSEADAALSNMFHVIKARLIEGCCIEE